MPNPFVNLQSSRSDQPAVNLTSSQLTVTIDPATGQQLASIEPSGTTLGAVQRITADIPLATLQGKTSGTPFNVILLSAPPAGSSWRILAAEVVVNEELLSSNEAYSAATVKVGVSGGNDDAYSSAISVFGLTTGAAVSAPGTNNAPSQTGPFTLEVTLTNSTMAQLTQGDLTVNIYVALTD
jgi:hypothetical protein